MSGLFFISHSSRARNVFICSFCTSEIDSSPPPTAMGTLSRMICFAAVAMAIRPEPHCRSTLMPATLTGRPAATAALRAMLPPRSEEHTSELQSRENLVCRLLLEKKNLLDSHPLPPDATGDPSFSRATSHPPSLPIPSVFALLLLDPPSLALDTLSLHDALPIYLLCRSRDGHQARAALPVDAHAGDADRKAGRDRRIAHDVAA